MYLDAIQLNKHSHIAVAACTRHVACIHKFIPRDNIKHLASFSGQFVHGPLWTEECMKRACVVKLNWPSADVVTSLGADDGLANRILP